MTEKNYRRTLKRLASGRSVLSAHTRDWRRWRWLYLYGTDMPATRRHRRYRYDTIRVNMAHALIRALVPRVLYRDPRIFTEPQRAPDSPQAELSTYLVGHLLQYLWNEMDVTEEGRRCVIDTSCFGIGIVKLGFDTEFGHDEQEMRDYIQADVEAEKMRQNLLAVRTFAGLGPPAPRNGTSADDRHPTEYHGNVIREYPWVMRISPWDFLIDPEARTMDEARWVAHRYRRPAEDIRADDRYKGIRSKVDGQALSEQSETVWDELGDPAGPDRSGIPFSGAETVRSVARQDPLGTDTIGAGEPYGILYEVWDKQEGTVSVICQELGEPLMEHDDPLGLDGFFPFEALIFNEVPDRFYGKSDLQDIEPQILELNQIRQLGLQWLRRMVKFITISKEGELSEEQIKMLTNPDPFVHIPITTQGNVRDAIVNLDPHAFYPQIQELEERLKRDIRDVFGLSEEQMGATMPGVTATASANVAASVEIRIEDKKNRVERFCTRIATKMLEITRRFFPPEIAIRIVGDEGEGWLPLSAEDIRRDYDVKIEAGSAVKPQGEVKVQQLVELGNLALQVAPPMVPGQVPFDWTRFFRRVLYAQGDPDPGSILQAPAPTAMQPPLMPGMGAGPPGGAPMLPPIAGNGSMAPPPGLAPLSGGIGGPGAMAPPQVGIPPVAAQAPELPGRVFARLLARARSGGMAQ